MAALALICCLAADAWACPTCKDGLADGDGHLATGAELWSAELPASGQASPMTYRARPSGRQYVVIAAGGHDGIGSSLGDHVIAFALPFDSNSEEVR